MSTPKVYLVRAGRFGEREKAALENNLAIVGFSRVPSLADIKDREALRSLVEAAYPEASKHKVTNFTGQLWSFIERIQPGDIIALPRKATSQIALGKVTGSYGYRTIDGEQLHTIPVEWIRTDIPRTAFEQDLLFSLGAFMTVCRIQRNRAEERFSAVLAGKTDPGPVQSTISLPVSRDEDASEAEELSVPDLMQFAHDQIVNHVQSRFSGHKLSELVEAVLQADGWVTTNSPPGPDGGVDILAGRGPLGLDTPRLCVQIKSQLSPADVTVYRTLQGAMQTFNAEQGLLVCWGGFNNVVLREARNQHFTMRLWNSSDLINAVYRTYERLPEEIQTELPLKRGWILVHDGDAE